MHLIIWVSIFILLVYFAFKLTIVRSSAKWLLRKFLAWDTSRLAKKKANNKENIKMNQELFSSMKEVIERVGGPVLELGAGSGANMKYYPQGTKLMTIDLNENFKSYLKQNLEENQHVELERYILGNVENMDGLVADNSCSCVVSSLILCCVTDQEKALREVMRVLKPGGRLYFVEHIVERPGTWVRYAQEMMKDTWASLRANCTVNRDTNTVIENFGFDNVNGSIVYRTLPKMFFFARRSYVGYADKPLK